MYCKLAGCMLIVAGGIMLGFRFAFNMKRRMAELRELQRIINYIEGEITYRHTVLGEVCLSVAAKAGQPFKSWLLNLGNRLTSNEDIKPESFYTSWCSSLDYLKENTRLRSGDITVLKSLGQALGYLDIKTQQMTLELEKENLNNIIRQAEKELAGHIRIAVVFSVLGSLMVVIMLV